MGFAWTVAWDCRLGRAPPFTIFIAIPVLHSYMQPALPSMHSSLSLFGAGAYVSEGDRCFGGVQLDTGVGLSTGPAASTMSAPPPGEPISLALEEKLLVVLNKDGGVENMEVQGTIALQACPHKSPLTLKPLHSTLMFT